MPSNPKLNQKQTAKPEEPKLTRLQKFETVRVRRSEINAAPYNPRRIDPENRKRLHGNLQKRGLLNALVVNRLTMNLVSGHQRLEKIDAAEGYPAKDYLIDVNMVELSEQEEKEQNIFFNARSAQGDFDAGAMSSLLSEIDTTSAGLTDIDLALYAEPTAALLDIEAPDFSELFQKRAAKKKIDGDEDELRQEATNFIKGQKAAMQEHAIGKADKLLSYLTLNFPTMADKAAFMERFGLDTHLTFIDGNEFSEMCEAIIEPE